MTHHEFVKKASRNKRNDYNSEKSNMIFKKILPKVCITLRNFWFRRSSQIKTEKRGEGTEKTKNRRLTEQIFFWKQIILNFFYLVAFFGKYFVAGFSKKEWK